MADISWDTSQLEQGISNLLVSVGNKTKKALNDIATEVLRLSQVEVPHDLGTLQNSGQIDPGEDENEVLVGYNTVYAAYQHEGMRADGTHVVTHWQSGRKSKYLEDPIRNNIDTFINNFNGLIE